MPKGPLLEATAPLWVPLQLTASPMYRLCRREISSRNLYGAVQVLWKKNRIYRAIYPCLLEQKKGMAKGTLTHHQPSRPVPASFGRTLDTRV
jgi:hypothetical protein